MKLKAFCLIAGPLVRCRYRLPGHGTGTRVSMSTTGRIILTSRCSRTLPRKPESRSSTTVFDSNEILETKDPGGWHRLRTWSCLQARFWRARSRPVRFRSWTSPNCPIWAICGMRCPSVQPSTTPAMTTLDQLHVGHHRYRLQCREGQKRFLALTASPHGT